MRVKLLMLVIFAAAVMWLQDDCRHDWAKWPGHPNNGGYYTCQKCGGTRAIHW